MRLKDLVSDGLSGAYRSEWKRGRCRRSARKHGEVHYSFHSLLQRHLVLGRCYPCTGPGIAPRFSTCFTLEMFSGNVFGWSDLEDFRCADQRCQRGGESGRKYPSRNKRSKAWHQTHHLRNNHIHKHTSLCSLCMVRIKGAVLHGYCCKETTTQQLNQLSHQEGKNVKVTTALCCQDPYSGQLKATAQDSFMISC